jgi:steroid delta-isomerase-like uncharacterized protein
MAQQAVQSIIDTAKAATVGYNNKDWAAVKAVMTADCVYDEVATQRNVKGVDQVLEVWKGWAAAMPDSRATFERAMAVDNTVVLEVTWRGTHTGPLQTPKGPIAPTGRKIELRACQIMELAGDKVQTMRQYFDMATLLQQFGLQS